MDADAPRILLVDDTEANLDMLCELLEPEGYRVAMAPNGQTALRIAARMIPDLILLDVMMPDIDGFEVCRRLKQEEATREIPVIFITAQGLTESLVSGFEVGGVDYIAKPFRDEEVLVRVRTHVSIAQLSRQLAERNTALARKNEQLEEEIALRKLLKGQLTEVAAREAREWGLDSIVGKSPTIEAILKKVQALQAQPGTSVLIEGESGSGKELVARAVHYGSPRRDGPFVRVDCHEIPEDIIESLDQRTQALSLLFGHVQGAFAGADTDRDGYFRMAHGGTLYFDEISCIPVPLQAALLRALESGEVRRIGDPKGIAVDVRILAATEMDLQQRVDNGALHQDLHRVLSRATVPVPPLRERPEDIPLLARHFLQHCLQGTGREVPTLDDRVSEALRAYPFPGNVRELKNMLERAALESAGHEINVGHLHLPAAVVGIGAGAAL
jgi:DNA-binding NtrC family response regulator